MVLWVEGEEWLLLAVSDSGSEGEASFLGVSACEKLLTVYSMQPLTAATQNLVVERKNECPALSKLAGGRLCALPASPPVSPVFLSFQQLQQSHLPRQHLQQQRTPYPVQQVNQFQGEALVYLLAPTPAVKRVRCLPCVYIWVVMDEPNTWPPKRSNNKGFPEDLCYACWSLVVMETFWPAQGRV